MNQESWTTANRLAEWCNQWLRKARAEGKIKLTTYRDTSDAYCQLHRAVKEREKTATANERTGFDTSKLKRICRQCVDTAKATYTDAREDYAQELISKLHGMLDAAMEFDHTEDGPDFELARKIIKDLIHDLGLAKPTKQIVETDTKVHLDAGPDPEKMTDKQLEAYARGLVGRYDQEEETAGE